MTIEQADQIIQKLDQIINLLQPKTSKPNKKQKVDQSGINNLMHICTHPGYEAKEYCDALKQLRELDFALSAKQMAWIMFYGLLRHSTEGEATDQFLSNQISRRNKNNRNDYVEEIRKLIQQNYKGDVEYKAKLDYYLKSKLS